MSMDENDITAPVTFNSEPNNEGTNFANVSDDTPLYTPEVEQINDNLNKVQDLEPIDLEIKNKPSNDEPLINLDLNNNQEPVPHEDNDAVVNLEPVNEFNNETDNNVVNNNTILDNNSPVLDNNIPLSNNVDTNIASEPSDFDPVNLIDRLSPDYQENIEKQLGLDLKSAINEIRNTKDSLSAKGFNVSLEEIDLDDCYQFNIKIKKD